MATYYSPNGNPEVWAEKPAGYFTPEEWDAAHPAPEPIPPTDEELAAQVRAERNSKLAETDYLMLTDSTLTAEQNAEFVAYRQDLRDITAQPGFPNNVTWPTKPELQ